MARSEMLRVRFSDQERRRLIQLAELSGRTQSDVVRSLVLLVDPVQVSRGLPSAHLHAELVIVSPEELPAA